MSNEILSALTVAQLVVTYNNLAAIVDLEDVKRFADKAKGVARVEKMLGRVNEYRVKYDLPLIALVEGGVLVAVEPPAPEVPAEKPVAAKVVKTAKKAPGRVAAVSPSDVIVVLVAGNPKFAGAAERFAKYASGIRVADYIAALGGDKKQALRDINWDTKQNWIQVVGPKSAAAKALAAPKPATTEEAAPLLLAPPAALLMIAGPVADPAVASA